MRTRLGECPIAALYRPGDACGHLYYRIPYVPPWPVDPRSTTLTAKGFSYEGDIMRTAITVALAAAAVMAGTAPALAGTPSGTITVGRPITTVRPGAIGADEPFWNGELRDRRSPQLMRRAGIRMLDFDAGGPIDLYHWRTNTLTPSPGGAANPVYATLKPEFTFDQFERTAQRAGATTMVHVNYGTGPDSTAASPTPGDPAEAAAWVRYANRTRNYRVKYWAVGEETYLDSIGEPDAHKKQTPQ